MIGFITLLFSLQSVAANTTTLMLTLSNNQHAPALIAGPEDAKTAVLIVHDWFGVSEFTRSSVERLGQLGYRTLAVDLYQGQSATTHEQAEKLMNGRDQEQTQQILQAGINALKHPGRKIITLGFSMGAIEALRANLIDPAATSGGIMVYGFGFDKLSKTELNKLQSPTLVITGALDEGALQTALNFVSQTKPIGKSVELYVYPKVDHAYAQPLFNQGKNYDAEATRVTWLLIEDFIKRHAPIK